MSTLVSSLLERPIVEGQSTLIVFELGLVTPIGAGVGMDPDVGEAVDRNGACSLGHLGYRFRLHPVALSLLTNLKSPS